MNIALLGFPWDASSSHARGPALAPPLIRAVLFSPASSPRSIGGVDLHEAVRAYDFAGLPEDGEGARGEIRSRTATALAQDLRPIALGGDHSVTFPILQAVAADCGPVNVLHIDAHPDLYDTFQGDPFSHACPFARALEAGCIGNLVQLGIRASAPEHEEVARRHDIAMLGADETGRIPYERLSAPLYVSIDLDGLDPAFAPGVSHPEPGGLSTRDVIAILHRLPSPPVGADIVELNPERDINLLTAHVAARLVKELAGAMTPG